ncbi:MAG: hypothetical protein GY732_22975, partial [Gammaproteobacteria bacterium]|nr:hypothetical protein [Gammaproteobacteria bacterium]
MTKILHLLVLILVSSSLATCAMLETNKGQSQTAPEESPVASPSEVKSVDSTSAAEQPEQPKQPKDLDNTRSYQPYVVASKTSGTLEQATTATISALENADFEIVGQYSPVDDTNIIVATNNILKTTAARSPRGGYAAGQRISVTETNGTVEVGYVNPVYLQYAYHVNGDLQPVLTQLSDALGMLQSCGADKKKMTAKKLDEYHYMIGMQYFDDVSELGSFGSHDAAVAAVEKGLANPGDALTQVYRIDVPGAQQTVFGVGMKATSEDDKPLDSAFQMSVVDYEGCKKRAYFPYEVLIVGNNVEALHMRFRMAVHYPDLIMMGSHGFTKLISSPGAVESALE